MFGDENETLRRIASELVFAVKRNITIEWSVRESAQAKLKVIVKKNLEKYRYSPDKQENAIITVLDI